MEHEGFLVLQPLKGLKDLRGFQDLKEILVRQDLKD
jgi:hypothetical protein